MNYINNINTIFSHSSWLNVLRKSYGFEIATLNIPFSDEDIKSEIVQENSYDKNDRGISFVIKKKRRQIKYISLPYSDEVPILNNHRNKDQLLSKSFNDIKNVYVELRCRYDGQDFENKLVGYKHTLDLIPDEDRIFKGFKKTQVQQPIQKAERDGLIGKVKSDYEAVLDFYELHLLTRRKLGVPIQPKKFFFHFYNEIIKNDLGFVVLVYQDKNVISAGIFAGVNKILTYKFSASNPDYLKYRPNNLMLWTAIQEAKKRRFDIFDFGRTELGNEGLRKFKQGWGTVEAPLYYSYYPKVPDKSRIEFIKAKIVAPIIRNSPKFVCRLSGELFYKYFG